MAIPIFKMATIGLLPSFLKKTIYRLNGGKIGKNCYIGIFSIIDSDNIEIGKDVKLGSFSFIKTKSLILKDRAKIGSMVAIETGSFELGEDSMIMEQVVVGGMLTPRSTIKIGRNVKIFPFCFINPTEPILIGDNVGIGGSTYIFTHGSWQSILDGFPVSFGSVTIESGVWFPWRVFVLPNVTVGQDATIGAGSIINKSIPARSLAAGVPAKVIKNGSDYIKKFSENEKHEILLNIFKEYSEFLKFKYDNKTIELQINENQLIINYSKNKKIIYLKNPTKIPEADVIIFNSAINSILIEDFKLKNLSWFCIPEKKARYSNSEIWLETRDFLSRYGIRFDIIC